MSTAAAARTRGFPFADLRGYTEFVETHGDPAAARLLADYRQVVRAAVTAHEGAEIRTEGDSVFVVFPSVGAAVTCGLAIAAAAETATASDPERPMRVGVGIHAGETVETAEGFVGSAVNVAARVCARAAAGEVLVTEIVRALTRTSLDVRFEARGSHRLKGVGEHMALFAALPGAAYPVSTTAPARNPYKGLRPFGEHDRADFFGREALIDRLVEHLGRAARVSHLLTVVGPSGSGKSSVVRAGLLPALGEGAVPGSETWRVAVMYPGARPFEELAAALRGAAPTMPSGATVDLERDGDIERAMDAVAPGVDDRLLLVIDQFEELFTVVHDDSVRMRFMAALGRALATPRSRLLVVIVVRADFLDRPLLSPELGELVRDGMEAVTPLSREELEAAITRPGEAVGLELEPGLSAEVIADVINQPGALPQLEYALTELFERSDGRRLTRETYAAIGGVLGALGKRAEETYLGLDPDAREVARQVLLRLVVTGEGVEATGRRVSTSELRSLSADPADVDRVIDAFGRWRLLSFDRDVISGEPTVEIAHDALLTRWPRLAAWVEDERESLWTRRGLAAAAAEWSQAGSDPSFLLSGSRLEHFEAWAASTDLLLDPTEQAFLHASVEEKRRRDLEEQTRVAHEHTIERQSASRLRALVVVFAAAALLAGGLLAVVLGQADTARRQEQAAREAEAIATSRELAAASVGNLGTDPTLSLLLGIEAARATADRGYVTEEAIDALHWALQTANVPYPLRDGATATRPGPTGPRGIYILPPVELVELAARHADRPLTAQECRTYLHRGGCPAETGATIGDTDLWVRTEAGTVAASAMATRSLAGTTVQVLSELPADLAALSAEFERQSGISLVLSDAEGGDAGSTDAEGADLVSMPTGRQPDVAILSQPSLIASLAREGRLVDLSAFLDAAPLHADLGDYLLSLGTLGSDGSWPAATGELVGLPVAASLGGVVWYPPSAFRQAGYAVPGTWEDLLALSRDMVADGRTPWCLGVEDGARSGAAAADWVADLLLGQAGPAVYQDWAVGGLGQETGTSVEIGDFRVRQAFRSFDEVVLPDGFVLGGAASAALIPETIAAWPLARAPSEPACWMILGTGIDRAAWPGEVAAELDWFPLPAVDARFAEAASAATWSLVVFHDRPEVRELVRYLAGEGFAATLVADPGMTGLLSPRSVDPATIRDAVDRAQAERLWSARQAGTLRSDASGLMSPPLASSLRTGMLSYLTAGQQRLETLLDRLAAGQDAPAAASETNALRATVTYADEGCTYRGPLVVPSGARLTVDFSIVREEGLGRLILVPLRSGTPWESVRQAEARPASAAPDARSLPVAWPTLSMYSGPSGPGRTQSLAGPGSFSFDLGILEEGGLRYDSFLVVCTATDVEHPSAGAIIRLVSSEGPGETAGGLG